MMIQLAKRMEQSYTNSMFHSGQERVSVHCVYVTDVLLNIAYW